MPVQISGIRHFTRSASKPASRLVVIEVVLQDKCQDDWSSPSSPTQSSAMPSAFKSPPLEPAATARQARESSSVTCGAVKLGCARLSRARNCRGNIQRHSRKQATRTVDTRARIVKASETFQAKTRSKSCRLLSSSALISSDCSHLSQDLAKNLLCEGKRARSGARIRIPFSCFNNRPELYRRLHQVRSRIAPASRIFAAAAPPFLGLQPREQAPVHTGGLSGPLLS